MNILFFGIAKDIVGQSEIQLEPDPNIRTVSDLISFLKDNYPEFKKLDSMAVAVNSEYAAIETIITPKDEIAIIPPVSGG
jgi:molybdopterin converting factor subunit 1